MNVRETSVLLERVGYSEVARVPFGRECVRGCVCLCQEMATQPPGGAFNTPWLLDVFVLVQQGGMKSLELCSCLRKP